MHGLCVTRALARDRRRTAESDPTDSSDPFLTSGDTMDFMASDSTATLALLVGQHAATGTELRIDQLDGWTNPMASTSLCFCYTGAAPITDGNA